jgi:hypothetical protein
MNKIIRENWFKILLLLLIALLIYLYYNSIIISKLYQINSDCAQKAISYAETNSKYSSSWQVVQSIFNEEKVACFAEFRYMDLDNKITAEIHDLTHNKFIEIRPRLMPDGDITLYTEAAKKYEATKIKIFGVQNL